MLNLKNKQIWKMAFINKKVNLEIFEENSIFTFFESHKVQLLFFN